jgi:Sec7-like guanine-nucleotide exchange factor
MDVLNAVRAFSDAVAVRGEAQQIERMIDAVSECFDNKDGILSLLLLLLLLFVIIFII